MSPRILTIIILLVLVSLFYGYGRFVEPYRLTITRLDLQIKGYFQTSGSLRTVLLSDLHIEEFGRREEKVLEAVSGLEPDIIFITGDFIQTRSDPDGAAKFVSCLTAPLGIWGIIGNIDKTAPDLKELITRLEDAGLTMLINKRHRIAKDGLEFDLVGLSLKAGEETIKTVFQGREGGIPEIVLMHWPRLIDKVIPYQPQLILCGHTHGGQVRLPLIGKAIARFISGTHYDMGLFQISNTWLYVNRGVGMTNHPIRLFCPPEVSAINLEVIQLPFN